MKNHFKHHREFLIDIFCDILGSILYSIGIYTFAKDAGFAPGGMSGLALIINHLWNIPIGFMTLILNIPFILFSYKVVGRKFLLKTAKTMLITTFFLDIVFPYLPPTQAVHSFPPFIRAHF